MPIRPESLSIRDTIAELRKKHDELEARKAMGRRVSGVLFAHDPLGVARFGRADEYDGYADRVLDAGSAEDLARVLDRCELNTAGVFESLCLLLVLSRG